MPATNISSNWSSGDLIFHEATAKRPATGYNVLTIGDDAVTVGDGTNDIDFKVWTGAASYALFDFGNTLLTLEGMDVALSGDLAVTVGTVSLADDLDLEFGTGTDVLMRFSTADDSDHCFVIALDNTSQQMHITDKLAVATDWARTAGTHPEIAIHSNSTPINDYLAIGNHDGTTAHIDVVGGTTLSLDIGGTPEYTFTAAGIDMNDNAMTEVGNMTFTDGSIIAAIDGGATSLIFKSGGLTGTTFITLNSVSAGTDNMILGKAFFYDAGGESIESNGSILTITGPTVAFVGAVTGDTDLTVTSTAPGASVEVIDGAVSQDGTANLTGTSLKAVKGQATWTATGGYTGNSYGGWFGITLDAASGMERGGILAGIYAEAHTARTENCQPSAVGYFQSVVSGAGIMANMPILVLTSTGGSESDKSMYAIEFGHAPAGTTVGAGSGYMYYNETIKVKVNTGDRFIPLSTIEGTYTTAYPIVSTNLAAFDATVTMANTAANVIRATVTDTGTRSSGDARGLRCSYTVDAASTLTGTAAAIGCGITFTVSDHVPYLYGYKLYLNTISNKTITQISGFYVYMEDVGNAAGHASCMSLNRNISNVGTTSDCFLEMRNHGSTAATGFIKVTGSATHLFDFGYGDQVAPVSAATDSANVTHKISVRMADGATRYLRLWSD